MSSENIHKKIVENFISELPVKVPVSKLAVINLPRSANLQNFISEDQKADSVFIEYKAENPESATSDIIKNLESKKYIFIKFVGYLSPETFSFLESISKNGWADVNTGENIERYNLPQDSHVILVSERKFIESQYGNLNNLTTYILDLENS